MRFFAIPPMLLAFAMFCRISPAEETPKRSVELEVLGRFIGSWESVVTIKTTSEILKTTEKRKWSQQGQFVISEELDLLSKKESLFLLTYDYNDKVYRGCAVTETNVSTIRGTWDDKAHTMNWNGTFEGIKIVGSYRFIDKDSVEWSNTYTDSDGKVVWEMSAKQSRRKE